MAFLSAFIGDKNTAITGNIFIGGNCMNINLSDRSDQKCLEDAIAVEINSKIPALKYFRSFLRYGDLIIEIRSKKDGEDCKDLIESIISGCKNCREDIDPIGANELIFVPAKKPFKPQYKENVRLVQALARFTGMMVWVTTCFKWCVSPDAKPRID